ncbi:thioredoxin-like protein [Russula ochroleuca]|uniref:Thioredoxin n=1 Tax=Russula ochroleuca TaxID=152965 RepID=A0A9P5MXZ1_9AGAM|nr:thioredoxin-like protein [Russula ochroleuca]
MTVAAINSHTEFQNIIKSGHVVVIDFWAAWCGPCRVISPIFEKLAEREEFSALKFYKVDVDAQEAISQQVDIRAMPTFIMFKGGQKVEEVVGANPAGLENLLRTAISIV